MVMGLQGFPFTKLVAFAWQLGSSDGVTADVFRQQGAKFLTFQFAFLLHTYFVYFLRCGIVPRFAKFPHIVLLQSPFGCGMMGKVT